MKERSHAMVPCKTWYEVTPNGLWLFLSVYTMLTLQWVSWVTANSQNCNVRWHWSCSWRPRYSHQHNITSICRCLHFESRPEYGILLDRTNSRVHLNIELSCLTALPCTGMHSIKRVSLCVSSAVAESENSWPLSICRRKINTVPGKQNLHVVFPSNAVAWHMQSSRAQLSGDINDFRFSVSVFYLFDPK